MWYAYENYTKVDSTVRAFKFRHYGSGYYELRNYFGTTENSYGLYEELHDQIIEHVITHERRGGVVGVWKILI